MANPFTFVSLIVMLQTCVCYSGFRCYFYNSHCSWETWGSWNMDCTCGVKDVRRIRTRYCKSNYDPNYTCRYESSDTCEALCYNGGTFNYKEGRCDCSERFSGKCCKEVISKCQPIPADVIFILDSSISQTRAQFRKQLEFVETFVNATTLGAENFTVGVITFSFDVHYEIKLNESIYNKTVFLNQLRGLPFRPGATFTDKALVLANEIVNNRSNIRPSGAYKRSFVFVLTDGMSNNRDKTANAARELHKHAEVVAIGVGPQVSYQELVAIASPKNEFIDTYVYTVGTFDALFTVLQRLVDATCEHCVRRNDTDVLVLLDDFPGSKMADEEWNIAMDVIMEMTGSMTEYGKPRGQRVGLVQVSDETRPHVHVHLTGNASQASIYNTIQTIKPVPGQCDRPLEKCDSSFENITKPIEFAINNLFPTDRTKARKVLLIVTSGRFSKIDHINATMRDVLKRKSDVDVYVLGTGVNVKVVGTMSLVNESANVIIVPDKSSVNVINILDSKVSFIQCSADVSNGH